MPGSVWKAARLLAEGVVTGHLWEWLLLAATWAIRVGALVIVPFRRSPTATQSWLLLFFVAPWVALALYLAIGRPVHPLWRRQRVAQLWPLIERAIARIERAARPPELLPAQATAAALIRGIGRMLLLEGNAVDFMTDYDDTIDRLVKGHRCREGPNPPAVLYLLDRCDGGSDHVGAGQGRGAGSDLPRADRCRRLAAMG